MDLAANASCYRAAASTHSAATPARGTRRHSGPRQPQTTILGSAAEAAELARGGAYKRGNISTTCLEPKPLPPLQEAHGASMRSRRFHILLLSSPSYTIRVAASTRCARVRVLRLTEMVVFLLPHSHPLSTLFQYIHRSDDSARRSPVAERLSLLTSPTS